MEKTEDGCVKINQTEIEDKICRKFKVEEMKPVRVPLLKNDVDKLGAKLLEDRKIYQKLVGILNYFAAVSRLDLAFT
eukprot:snap_masked-scaffold_69-processed-gene-0.33-mRNA-1 protein AED:1.00 eAED:1.00 QI:0/-1/0/0/-1/1/1/0/76